MYAEKIKCSLLSHVHLYCLRDTNKIMSVFEEFCKEVQPFFSKTRLADQQEFYEKFSGVYDEVLEEEKGKRFQFISDVIDSVVEDKTQSSIIDYGCGSGKMG